MATSNLKLQTINGSDYVDPEVFNANYEILDKLGIDYIEQSGTSGIWRYQRWKSGKYECWGRFATASTNYNHQYGGLYYPGYSFKSPNFPITFSDVPVVIPSLVSKNTAAGHGGVWDVFVSELFVNNANISAAVNEQLNGITIRIALYVIGTV